MDLTKDVEIGESRYQVGRFKARDGSWVLAQILTKMLPAAIESSLQGSGLAANRAQISEEEFASIQAIALSVCRRYENNIPMPVFPRPDTWAIKDLEYDLVTVMRLTIEALVFNITPFFKGNGLAQMMESLPRMGQSSPTSQT